MMLRRFPLLAALASVTVFAVGCAGSADANDETEQGSAAALSASAHAPHSDLSKDLLCAAVSLAEQNTDGTGMTTLSERDLKGDALGDFREFQKGMASDYPSEAFTMPVKLGSKTYDFIFVVETNDGGGSMGIYRTDGSTIATESSGESDGFSWSSPADKCD